MFVVFSRIIALPLYVNYMTIYMLYEVSTVVGRFV